MENLISVIVCTYNQEDTIGRTLDSVLMQQCHVPYEIILGEDCSTDGTLEVCKRYAEQHPDTIHLIANATNKGVVKNYFDCILASHGRYIADCAGDDFWVDPQKLEKEVSVMEKHPDVTMVLTRWNWFDETSHQTKLCAPPPYGTGIIKGSNLLEHIITQTDMSVFHLCTSLYSAQVFRQAYNEHPFLFQNKEFPTEDIQVAFMMAQHGDLAYLPDVTLHYSTGKPSASLLENHERQYRFVKGVSELCFYLTETYNIHSQHIENYFDERIFALAMHAFRAKSVPLCQETLQCERNWHTQRNAKTSVAFLIMKSQILWNVALLVRKLYVSVKQALH